MKCLSTRPIALFAAAAVIVAGIVLWQRDVFSQSVVPGQLGGQPRSITWTRLPTNNDVAISVAKVPGGWFVSVLNLGTNIGGAGTSDGAFFYPDPLHEWNGYGLP
jgi:hypothetical protein